MNSRTIFAALGTTAVAVTSLGAMSAPVGATAPAAVSPSAATSSLCELRIVSIKARDIQEDNQGTDEVRLRLGNTDTTQRTYFEGQKRNALGDGDVRFTSPVRVRLLEVDGAAAEVLDSTRIPCVNRTGTTKMESDDGDAVYKVAWDVNVLVP